MGIEQYRIGELIGEGASAKVYKAVDTQTDSIVAVKILNPHLQTDAVSLERFKREIQITRALNHPQVVSIYDLIREDDRTCLVMEYLDGVDLKEFIASHQPLAIDTAVDILRQVLGILSRCHAGNVIHRDIKPGNIIIDTAGNARLLDFGIARMTTLSDLTQTGTSIGSPEYMAPEVFGANIFDPRTDIYALGVIAFEMLAGRRPFAADSLPVLYNQHRNSPVPSLDEIRDDIPPWLRHVIERMLTKQAYERYQSADEVLLDLRRRRVLMREMPAVEKHECLRCGERTPAEVPVCLHCGNDLFESVKGGDYDVVCNRDEDDEKLAEFFESAFGVSKAPPRRGRTLLATGLDSLGAELMQRSAKRHHVALVVKPHPPSAEFRKATAIAFVAFVISWLGDFLGGRYAYYGARLLFSSYRLNLLHVPIFAVWAGVIWMGLTRFRRIEVEPLFRTQEVLRRGVTQEWAVLRRIVPLLRVRRTPEVRGFVAQLAEKYFKLVRFARDVDAPTAQALGQLLENGARLGAAVSEIETAVQKPIVAERAQRYAFLENQARVEQDPQRRATLEEHLQALHEELTAYLRIEEKRDALQNKLIVLHALMNRLLGRLLVIETPLDDDDREQMDALIRSLARDLDLSREVQAELSRL